MTNGKVTLRDLMDMSEKIDTKLNMMGKRVTALEVWKAVVMGKVALLTAGIALVFAFTKDYIIEKLTK